MHRAGHPAHSPPLLPRYTSDRLPPERLATLALAPVCLTGLFYAFAGELPRSLAILFLPQALAYCGLAIWARQNRAVIERLGLAIIQLRQGLRWGIPTGLALGVLNVSIILWVVPGLGGDIEFLRSTPHALAPPPLMLPWMIIAIAFAIELNFRGFLLGRFLALSQQAIVPGYPKLGMVLAVGLSSLAFAFDPFMVVTFKHLHWIALWDGIVWGTIWLRLRNLYAPITAHAVEVIVMYSVMKLIL